MEICRRRLFKKKCGLKWNMFNVEKMVEYNIWLFQFSGKISLIKPIIMCGLAELNSPDNWLPWNSCYRATHSPRHTMQQYVRWQQMWTRYSTTMVVITDTILDLRDCELKEPWNEIGQAVSIWLGPAHQTPGLARFIWWILRLNPARLAGRPREAWPKQESSGNTVRRLGMS